MSDGMTGIEPLAPGLGRIFRAGSNGGSWSGLDREEVIAALRESGAVVFRGFERGIEAFEEFTRRFRRSLLRSPSIKRPRHPQSDFIQAVTSGRNFLNYHFEFGRTPFQPDLIWFCCESPAASGGRTLLCDGAALWERLSPAAREMLSARRISYNFSYPEAGWDDLAACAGFTREELSARDDLSTEIVDGTVNGSFLALAVTRARLSGLTVFSGNFFPGVYLTPIPPAFEDGAPLPAELVEEVELAARELTVPVLLEAGDAALIDNTRVLHGREGFEGSERAIFTLCGNANF